MPQGLSNSIGMIILHKHEDVLPIGFSLLSLLSSHECHILDNDPRNILLQFILNFLSRKSWDWCHLRTNNNHCYSWFYPYRQWPKESSSPWWLYPSVSVQTKKPGSLQWTDLADGSQQCWIRVHTFPRCFDRNLWNPFHWWSCSWLQWLSTLTKSPNSKLLELMLKLLCFWFCCNLNQWVPRFY